MVGDVYQVRILCYNTFLKQIALNNLYYRVTSEAGTGGTAPQLRDVLDPALAPVYKAWMPVVSRYRGVWVRLVSTPLPLPYSTFASDGIGTGGADGVPAQVSGVISFTTPYAGRHYRGRIYPGFPSGSFMDSEGQMTGPGLTALADIRDQLVLARTFGAGANTSLAIPCVRAVFLPPAPPQYYGIVAGFANSSWGTQRRRGDYGRTNDLPW